jgi:ABC-type transport system involved in multi-copper enzyme maturation permease subunit
VSVVAAERPLPLVRQGFVRLVHAEWTKFRTVRGWAVGMIIAALLTAGIALLDHSECGGQNSPGGPVIAGCPAPPVGPGGEAVVDNFYFVHRALAGDGNVTARLASLTGVGGGGLGPWAKAGIMIKASTRPGSAYAAMLVTGGHGVRMQYDYTGDIAGPSSGGWLRLSRAGDMVTGYESGDGVHWTAVGTVRLAGLPGTVQAGMFAASPTSSQTVSSSINGSTGAGVATVVAGRFDHVSLPGPWTGGYVGRVGPGGSGFHLGGGAVTVAGSGDIGPDVPGLGGDAPMERTLVGVFGGLIAVIVVAAMFMTAEYRRGLIRVTLTASPGRGRVLAAKALVIGGVAFVAGLVGVGAAVPLGERLLRSNGNQILPVSLLTEVRVVVGTAAILALTAVLALAMGTIVRQGAVAVTAVIGAIVLPYFLTGAWSVLPASIGEWLLRVTPAAGFAVEQSIPRYPQVSVDLTPKNGYYPLAPWAGFAVLCGYCVVALAVALVVLRRRDA